MAGYSKEAERQNEALKSVLRGETPEKRIMVGYNSGKEPEKHGDKIDPITDIFKDARMPWFCPECKKTMKIQLDDKMWRLYGHCFDCQIKIETKLKASGEYEEWEKNKIKENKKSSPKLCAVCNRAWHHKGHSYQYLIDFPKMGADNEICPGCKNDSLIEAYSHNDS